ncbi:YlaH-like family protein [Thermoactinomyces sp. DSM 45892]|uniref:YlaH-like family protein n=1 Tax=Thermoactinomyces sp. DSM 45892 TaxID=1882753 RepID=UPI0008963D25|nr:YlaH-like family protein [Thermoactinomyces sp. DSM 45892]SDY61881.1 YlaH-like protein [Thermoactinomyces sp. DSM 45892]
MFEWIKTLHFPALYVIIFVLTAIIYQSTFATRLSLRKNLLVYLFLAIGCFVITVMQVLGFPMIQALLITVVLIVVTKVRLTISKRNESKS